jgi:hypothetical protein
MVTKTLRFGEKKNGRFLAGDFLLQKKKKKGGCLFERFYVKNKEGIFLHWEGRSFFVLCRQNIMSASEPKRPPQNITEIQSILQCTQAILSIHPSKPLEVEIRLGENTDKGFDPSLKRPYFMKIYNHVIKTFSATPYWYPVDDYFYEAPNKKRIRSRSTYVPSMEIEKQIVCKQKLENRSLLGLGRLSLSSEDPYPASELPISVLPKRVSMFHRCSFSFVAFRDGDDPTNPVSVRLETADTIKPTDRVIKVEFTHSWSASTESEAEKNQQCAYSTCSIELELDNLWTWLIEEGDYEDTARFLFDAVRSIIRLPR